MKVWIDSTRFNRLQWKMEQKKEYGELNLSANGASFDFVSSAVCWFFLRMKQRGFPLICITSCFLLTIPSWNIPWSVKSKPYEHDLVFRDPIASQRSCFPVGHDLLPCHNPNFIDSSKDHHTSLHLYIITNLSMECGRCHLCTLYSALNIYTPLSRYSSWHEINFVSVIPRSFLWRGWADLSTS